MLGSTPGTGLLAAFVECAPSSHSARSAMHVLCVGVVGGCGLLRCLNAHHPWSICRGSRLPAAGRILSQIGVDGLSSCFRCQPERRVFAAAANCEVAVQHGDAIHLLPYCPLSSRAILHEEGYYRNLRSSPRQEYRDGSKLGTGWAWACTCWKAGEINAFLQGGCQKSQHGWAG